MDDICPRVQFGLLRRGDNVDIRGRAVAQRMKGGMQLQPQPERGETHLNPVLLPATFFH